MAAAPDAWPRQCVHPNWRVTDSDISTYNKNGYLIKEPFLADNMVMYARARAEEAIRQKHATINPEWLMNMHQLRCGT